MTGLAGRLANRARDLWFARPLTAFWQRAMRGRITCLLYHRVDEPEADPFLTRGGSPVTRPEQLRRELGFLQGLGVRFGTFEELRRGWFPAADEIGVIVSFDDCFRCNYANGLAVLDELGIRAVFFQTSGMVAGETLLWEHALYWYTRDTRRAERFAALVEEHRPGLASRRAGAGLADHLRETAPGPVVEDLVERAGEVFGDREEVAAAATRIYPERSQVRRAREGGHEIGSHGHRHYKRANVDDATFEADLARSKVVLEDLLGSPPMAFSYPFNSYLPGDDAIVGRYFEQAITVDKRRIERGTDPLWLPRFTWPGPPRSRLRERRWLLTGWV